LQETLCDTIVLPYAPDSLLKVTVAQDLFCMYTPHDEGTAELVGVAVGLSIVGTTESGIFPVAVLVAAEPIWEVEAELG
jgi:hypothetical protein